jgi:hypothetical protein
MSPNDFGEAFELSAARQTAAFAPAAAEKFTAYPQTSRSLVLAEAGKRRGSESILERTTARQPSGPMTQNNAKASVADCCQNLITRLNMYDAIRKNIRIVIRDWSIRVFWIVIE